MRKLEFQGDITCERWTLARPFIIAHTTYTHTDLIKVTLRSGDAIGHGEACPTAYYDETADSVLATVRAMLDALQRGEPWDTLHDTLPAGAARNAVDCAIWDLRAKQAGAPAWRLAGLAEPTPVETAFTLSLGAPDVMAAQALGPDAIAHRLLKLKLGGPHDLDAVRAVRAVAPAKRLIVDANEAWDLDTLATALPVLADLGVELIEQPLPAGRDEGLAELAHLVPIGADEACHTTADLDRAARLYDVMNIKLDKTGGLTEAIRLMRAAQDRGLDLMVGCMEGTSLSMAPATLLAPACRFVDLDGPLLIGSDRPAGLVYRDGVVHPPTAALWG